MALGYDLIDDNKYAYSHCTVALKVIQFFILSLNIKYCVLAIFTGGYLRQFLTKMPKN